MRLSEMPTQQATEALAKMLPALKTIAELPKVKQKYKEAQENKTPIAIFFYDILISLVAENADLIYPILSALEGKKITEIKSQNFAETLEQIKNNMDGTLISFFMHAINTVCGK